MKKLFIKYRYLVGFILIIIGGVLGALTGLIPFILLMLIGVFLFASLPHSQTFCDYVIAESSDVLVRDRGYLIFLPFYIVSKILTLGKSMLLIPCKQEYFVAHLNEDRSVTRTKITRKEYKVRLEEQRRIYSTQKLSKEFMKRSYTVDGIGLKHKKTRLILASIFAAISILFIFDPVGGIYLSAIYTPIFLPMVILWIPEYKDAKIIQQAYDRSGAAED
ncbi:MAG: hypothetical protein IJA55_02595 [Clostridia bacterium]|nr:hypothetical protein [Clostridia bacterium]